MQDNAPDAEDLQQPEIKVDEIESLAVPTSVPADATQTAAATAAEVRPATVPEPKDVISVRSRGQRSIMDFFKKGPVVMVQEVSSTLTHESVTSPAESVEAITFEAPEYIDSSEVEEEVIGAVNAGDYHDCQPGTSGEDALSDGVSAICEGMKCLPAASISIAGTTEDDQIAPSSATATPPNRDGHIPEAANRASIIDQEAAPNSAAENARDPVIARQKKKSSKAQSNAGKKRAAATTVANVRTTVVEEVEEPVTNADALIATAAAVAFKPSSSGRANRVSKRTTA